MCAERSASRGTSGSSLTRKSSRQLQARIFLLDDSVHTFSINSCAIGSELFTAIVEKQALLEADYFDLEYVNTEGVRCWIDHSRSIVRQVGPGKDLVFIFAVKFYTPHPNLLEEEYTRYLFALQIKRDIVGGQLICSTNTAALLASYIVQAEIGDFMEEDYLDNSYLRPLKISSQPASEDVLNKIVDFHRTHIGMSPSEADFHLLDTARKIEYYGVKMHLAKDHENLPLNLSVTHMGVVVFQQLTKINTFSWAKIRKLSFKRKKFLIKLHPEGYGYYKGMVEFYFETRDDCKRFWKKCIEHHSFFRCPAADRTQRRKPRVVTKGSSFRYCGRTQKELIEFVRENYSSKRDHFERPTKAKTAAKSPHGNKQSRFGKAYHPLANAKNAFSAPSRAVSDSSELHKVGNGPHTPLQSRSATGGPRPRWSRSAGESPRQPEEAPAAVDDTPPKDPFSSEGIERPPGPVEKTEVPRKGRRHIEAPQTGSSEEESPQDAKEDPLPAREAFRGPDRLCRQRASIGGLGDASDSDVTSRGPPDPTKTPPSVVCIDQYRGRRPHPPQSLAAARRFKSTPSNVAGDPRARLPDGKEDIPYVLLRRHKSPDQPRGAGSMKSVGQSRRSLVTKSVKEERHQQDPGPSQPVVQMRHSKSLDRRLADSTLRQHQMAPKSPKLLREEYMQSQRRLVSDRDTIEALKSQLRASRSERNIDGRAMFVSAYRLPPVNNFSAKDDTVASSERDDRLYGGGKRKGRTQEKSGAKEGRRRVAASDSGDEGGLRSTGDLEGLLSVLPGNPVYLDSSSSSDDEGEFAISPDRCSRPRSVSENEFRLRTPRSSRRSSLCRGGGGHTSSLSLTDSSFGNSDASFQTDDDITGSPYSFLADCGHERENDEGCKQPCSAAKDTQKVSSDAPQCNLFDLEAPRISEDSPENDNECNRPSSDLKEIPIPPMYDIQDNLSKIEVPRIPEDANDKDSSRSKLILKDTPVVLLDVLHSSQPDLQSLEAPCIPEDSPDEDEEVLEKIPCSEPLASTRDSMSIDRDESASAINELKMACSRSSSNTSASDRVVIVTAVEHDEPDASITTKEEPRPQSPDKKHNAISQALESMLQKRLTGVPFLRTSTPTKEYSGGSTGHLYQPAVLKPATSAPGLVRDRVSPFSPLPAHLRRPFTSSSSSSSSSSSASMSPPERNPFSNVSLCSDNPFTNLKPDLISVDNQYDDNLDDSVANVQPDLGIDLVFLNEGALSSISVGRSPTDFHHDDKFQEANPVNLESNRPQLPPDYDNDGDGEEEQDEYGPSNHRQNISRHSSSSSSSSSSPPTSDSGEYPAAEEGPSMSAQRIEEEDAQSESSTSTSEGSEEIEPFPPPPPQSDLLIFDERDEDIFQQMQQQKNNCGDTGAPSAEDGGLPQPDLISPSSDFPHPPPPPLTDPAYDPSSSDVPSLFVDDSAATSVMQAEEEPVPQDRPESFEMVASLKFVIEREESEKMRRMVDDISSDGERQVEEEEKEEVVKEEEEEERDEEKEDEEQRYEEKEEEEDMDLIVSVAEGIVQEVLQESDTSENEIVKEAGNQIEEELVDVIEESPDTSRSSTTEEEEKENEIKSEEAVEIQQRDEGVKVPEEDSPDDSRMSNEEMQVENDIHSPSDEVEDQDKSELQEEEDSEGKEDKEDGKDLKDASDGFMEDGDIEETPFMTGFSGPEYEGGNMKDEDGEETEKDVKNGIDIVKKYDDYVKDVSGEFEEDIQYLSGVSEVEEVDDEGEIKSKEKEKDDDEKEVKKNESEKIDANESETENEDENEEQKKNEEDFQEKNEGRDFPSISGPSEEEVEIGMEEETEDVTRDRQVKDPAGEVVLEVEEVIVPRHCSLLYDEENNECSPEGAGFDGEGARTWTRLCDGDNNDCQEEDNDLDPCPTGSLGQLQWRSPDGEDE